MHRDRTPFRVGAGAQGPWKCSVPVSILKTKGDICSPFRVTKVNIYFTLEETGSRELDQVRQPVL